MNNSNEKNKKDFIKKARNFYKWPSFNSLEIDELFYLYLNYLQFHLQEKNYLEASCSLEDLHEYDITNTKVQYHINSILGGFYNVS